MTEEISAAALQAAHEEDTQKLNRILEQGVSLDLSRGKPAPDQLELSLGMLDAVDSRSVLDSENGQDCRNYGGLDGLPEARRLMAQMMGTHAANTMIGGNSSLMIMYQLMSHAMVDGICGEAPWQTVENRKFLCPVPGYDRHFAITEHFGFEMINIPMLPTGPDMNRIEALVSHDPTIKGIWCVPKYQNPTGIVFSDETVRRFARLKPAAKDFRIFWDNAYCVHSFDGEPAEIPDILAESEAAGNPDIVYELTSTSKITFPGAGISALAASPANLIDIRRFLQYATIGPDKLNQLRHARFLKNPAGLRAHMQRHAALLRPKFETVQRVLQEELGDSGIAEWTKPSGGYFVSYNTPQGCASEVVRRCAACGVKFTPAGATFPHGIDPEDRNIRIAPSFASVSDIETAVRILAICTRLVDQEHRLARLGVTV